MIDGLKLTFSGEQLWMLFEERIRRHQESARRYRARAREDGPGGASMLPPQMCEDEADQHAWRARVLAFIRDHVDAAETYRLSLRDLKSCALLPPKLQIDGDELDTYDG